MEPIPMNLLGHILLVVQAEWQKVLKWQVLTSLRIDWFKEAGMTYKENSFSSIN
jgi:hypothetical protein